MKRVLLSILSLLMMAGSAQTSAQTWTAQPTNPASVPGLWGLSMFDTGRGIAVGAAAVATGLSGVVRKSTGNSTWQNVAPASFTPALSNSFPFWSGASAVKGTGTAFLCGSNAQIYKTTDYGATWTQKVSGISGSATFFDVFFKNVNDGLVVGASGIAYFTTDGGNNWALQATTTSSSLYAVHCAGNVWYVAGQNNSMHKFTTSPITWTNISGNLPSGTWPLIEGLQFLDDQTGTFSGYNTGGSEHVFRTTDGGATWNSFPSQPPLGSSLNFYSSVFFFTPSIGWVANAFDPLAYTSNGGSSWAPHSPIGSGAGAIAKLDFLDQQNGWAAGGALGGGPIPVGFILRYIGPPPAPDISTTSKQVSFGTLGCGASKDTIITVINSGNLALNVNMITFSSPSFSVVSPSLPVSIQPGLSADIRIRWTPLPTFSGTLNDSLTIKSNDPAHANWVVHISGFRQQGGVTLAPPNLNFPLICGTTFSDTTLTITPNGNFDPTFVSISWAKDDSGLTLLSPLPGTVLTGPTTFTFRLKPWRIGPIQGEYDLFFGDPLCPTKYRLVFYGDYRTNTISVTPAVFNFGDVCEGTVKEATVTVTNTGNTSGRIIAKDFISGSDYFPNAYASPFGPLPPLSSLQYKVRFAPPANDTGVFTGVYRLIVGTCYDTMNITLTGRSVRTNVAVTPPTPITLGPIATGQLATQALTVKNNGTTPVTVIAIRIQPANLALSVTGVPALPMAFAPSQALNFGVRYAPTKIETINATVCVVWDQPCLDSICIPLSAFATQPPTIVAQSSLNLGLQACRDAVRDSFVVRNTGLGPLNLLSFDFAGPQNAHFRIVRPTVPALVAAGDSVHVVVEYNAPSEGNSSATLTITHNDPKVPNSQSIVTLTGNRTITEYIVEGDTATAMSTCIKTATTRTFTIRNTSARQLSITKLVLTKGGPAFTLSAPTLPLILPAAGTAVITLTFQPTTQGAIDAVVSIVSEPCSYSTLIHVTGDGKRSQVSFNPTPVNFGAVNIGSTNARPVFISNSGFEPVTVTGIIVNPANAALSVSTAPSLPFVLDVSQMQQITLEYHPTSVGSLLTSVCITTSSPCVDTLCLPVLGLARADGIAFDKDSVHLLLDPCSLAGACDSITLLNNSARDVTITSVSFDTPGRFSISPSIATPFTLNSGQSQKYRVCSDAQFTGVRDARLLVQSNDPNRPLIELFVSAHRDSVRVLSDLRSIDFGVLPLCKPSSNRELVLRNEGTKEEVVQVVHSPSAPFSIPTSFPVRILPGQLARIDIAFSPASYGDFNDSLVLLAGTCATRISVALHGRFEKENYRVLPTPLTFGNVSIGGSQTLPLTLSNLNLPSLRVSAVRVNPASAFSYVGTVPFTVDSLQSTQLSIRFSPAVRGSITGTACIVFDAPCVDSVCVPLNGTGGDGDLVFLPSSLAFNPLAQCEEALDADTLLNAGTAPIVLTSSLVTGSGSGAFTVLNPVTASEQLASGSRRIFNIRFRPTAAADGPVTASLDVATASSSQPLISSPLRGTRVTQTMPVLSPVDFGSIPVGVPAQQIVQIRNGGSAPFTLTASNLPADVTVVPALPITINPGQTVQCTITFTPQVPGTQTRAGWLVGTSPCVDSLRIDLTANVSGSIRFADLPSSIVPNCEPTTRTLTLHNELAQTARITAITVGGADASFFQVVSPGSLPVLVGPRDSILIAVRCAPDASVDRVYTATIACDITDIPSPGPSTARITIDAREPVPALLSQMDFGIVPINTVKQLTAVFRNLLPFSVRVSSILANDPLYGISGLSASLPLLLLPGDSITATIAFSPTVSGTFNSNSFIVRTDQPCDGERIATLRGVGLDDYANATLSIPALEAEPDQIISLPILLNTDVGNAGVRSWSGSISFNPSMLYPLEVTSGSTLSSGMTVSSSYNHSGGSLSLSASGGTVLPGVGQLVVVRFRVLIGDAAETPVAISSSFDFTSGRARVLSRTDGLFRLTGYCVADGKRLVKNTPSTRILRNTPNPFNPGTTIEYEVAQEGFVELTVSDAMGRAVRTLVQTFQSSGVHRINFDAAELPSGLYFCILRSGGHSDVHSMLLSK